MPTAQQIAEQQEARRLRLAGLNEDGTPIGDAATPSVGGDDDDDDFVVPSSGGDKEEAALLREQVETLRRELAASQGRTAPAQQGMDQYRQLWETERAAREAERSDLNERLALLQQQLDTRNNALSVEELFSEDEQADFDPKLLNAIIKVADKIATARAPKVDVRSETLAVLEQREANKVKNYREKVLTDPARGLHQLGQLAYDPAFIAWSREDDNDMDSVVNSLLIATSTEEVDRYAKIVAKRIARFKDKSKTDPTAPPANGRTTLGDHMRRGPKAELTPAEIDTRLAEAKRLARSTNPADRQKAQQIINDLK